MKYVRTENDVYKLFYNSEFEHYEVIPKGLDRTRGQFTITENNIGKYETADTIEELCDEFVLKNDNVFPKPQILAEDYAGVELKFYKNEDVYGCIWTSKGLIYVAKMNKEGALELI